MTDLHPPVRAAAPAPLPGLEDLEDRDTGRRVSPLEQAARRTLAALQGDGLLTERHALTCQLILDLAQAIDAGRRSGRASAVAMAAAQLREAFLSLPEPEEGPESDGWEALARELHDAARRQTALRDPA